MKSKILLILLVSALFTTYTYGQGCSDAGFCSLGILKNNITDSVSARHQAIRFGLNYGLGEQQTSTINPYVEYSLKLGARFNFQSKITATYATGFLGSNFDIGDWYNTISYNAKLNSDNDLNFIAGVKTPFTAGNDKNSAGNSLPLDYQSSIGTYDAIGGINYIVHKTWEFDLAAQIPVIQINKNQFSPTLYSDVRALKFLATNNFRRKSDLLGRIGYYIPLSASSITLKPSLSVIYHLDNDSYENDLGNRTSIANSKGVTLNATIVATKRLSNGNQFEIILGAPFVVRKARPDGLTRDAVINFQYTIAF